MSSDARPHNRRPGAIQRGIFDTIKRHALSISDRHRKVVERHRAERSIPHYRGRGLHACGPAQICSDSVSRVGTVAIATSLEALSSQLDRFYVRHRTDVIFPGCDTMRWSPCSSRHPVLAQPWTARDGRQSRQFRRRRSGRGQIEPSYSLRDRFSVDRVYYFPPSQPSAQS